MVIAKRISKLNKYHILCFFRTHTVDYDCAQFTYWIGNCGLSTNKGKWIETSWRRKNELLFSKVLIPPHVAEGTRKLKSILFSGHLYSHFCLWNLLTPIWGSVPRCHLNSAPNVLKPRVFSMKARLFSTNFQPAIGFNSCFSSRWGKRTNKEWQSSEIRRNGFVHFCKGALMYPKMYNCPRISATVAFASMMHKKFKNLNASCYPFCHSERVLCS